MSIGQKEIIVESDVFIIGGGMAGIFAAVKAREEGATVTLADKGFVSCAGASSLNDGHCTVFNPKWGHKLSAWESQTAETGEYMNNPSWTKATLKDSYARFKDMLSWGIVPPKDADGELVRPFKGVKQKEGGIEAIWLGWGPTTMPILREHALEIGVRIVDHVQVTDLLTEDGCVSGAVGFHTQTGDFYIFKAKATIISTGTSGFRGQAPAGLSRQSFDGEAMAYRAGAEISGMEFAVMCRWTAYIGDWPADQPVTDLKGRKVDDTYFRYAHWLVGKAPINFMGNLVDSEGHGKGPFYPYSMLTIHEGRGPLLQDTEFVTKEELDRAVMLYEPDYERFAAVGADPLKRGLFSGVFDLTEAFLGRHMGGSGGVTSTGLDCGTTLTGLFGAGDSYHSAASGAVYPSGGTGLRVASTTGARAGQSAAKFAKERERLSIDTQQIARLKNRAFDPLTRQGGFDPDWVGEQVRSLILPYYIMGVRKGDRLQATLTLMEFLGNHIAPMLHARDAHGLSHAHEARNRILGAQMMLASALFRTESRGLHYREDYPCRNDEEWFAHITIKEKDGHMSLTKHPILTWWPGILNRPYLEKYPNRFRGE